MKNESAISVEENMNLSNAYRNTKMEKSQALNINSNTYSQSNKSSKP